jgi:FkbM family methyltransferase
MTLWSSRLAHFRQTLSIDSGLRAHGLFPGLYTCLTYRARLSERFPRLVPPKLIDVSFIDGAHGKSAKLTVRNGGVEGDLGILAGVVYDQEYWHVDLLSARRVLDLGSHIGIAATWFHLINPDLDIACVEPDPRNLKLLLPNLAKNEIRAAVVPCAVGGRPGEMAFGVGTNPSLSSLRVTEYYFHAEDISVEVKTLPQILDHLGWDHVDVVKMDIEGAERSLFASCREWAERVTTIVMEIHPNIDIDEAQRELGEYGFSLRRLGRGAEPTYVAER